MSEVDSAEINPDTIVAQADKAIALLADVRSEIAKAVFGQERVIDLVLSAVLAGGHALLVGAPGLAKTKLVETTARTLGLDWGRVQFTPDLMPGDILGSEVLDEAADGSQALSMFKEKQYGLVVSDWNMEPMSGLELLKGIRTGSNDNATVPFIMVTAESKTENIIMAKQAGVNNYIVKPFNAETLKTKIAAVLGPLD